ncbi:HNH endonuclease signature motif containing protein [Blastococcus atacamensis]|uniref:HNH endonuclease signature motif containing protein n=1 Tax=Blastococcus atacamensis TaxID=2070508 RepID=UPI0012FFE272|nr:HNH endonuclease signature motif containing protein [Blastococcus atacamensis]
MIELIHPLPEVWEWAAGQSASGPHGGDDAAAEEAGPTDLRRLLEVGADHLERAAEASRQIARLSAVVATSLAAFAGCRPSSVLDRQPGERGAMSAATRAARPAVLSEVSEWAVDEVAPTLGITSAAAGAQLSDSLVLADRLPGTLALLARGELSPAHARQMVNVVGPVEDDALRAEIEAHVLGLRGRKTPPQLGDCARRIVLRKDADAAARKLVAAVRERGVRLHDRRDGTATISLDLPLPAAAAIYRALEEYAEAARVEGDERTKQQRMADCVQELILRRGEHGMPPVTVALTLVATLETMLGGAEPGQVEGMLVSAAMVRELAYTLGLLPRPAPDVAEVPDPAPDVAELPDPAPDVAELPDPAPGVAELPDRDLEPPHALRSPSALTPTPVEDRTLSEWLALARARDEAAAGEALTGAKQAVLDGTWTDGEQRALLDVGALIGVRDVDGTGLAHRPQIAVVDKLRGSLVALTDAAGIRCGSALGPPSPSDGYTPGAALDRFVRLRDRRCRFPGCRARARTCDLDHRREWPHGTTSHENLCCLCEHHHRLRHQAPGWRFDEGEQGALAVTMPSGQVLVGHVPRFGSDLDLPPF